MNPTMEIPRKPSPSDGDTQKTKASLPEQLSQCKSALQFYHLRTLLQLDRKVRLRNILAGFLMWLLSPDFQVLRRSNMVKNATNRDKWQLLILNTVQIPHLWVVVISCIIGASGVLLW